MAAAVEQPESSDRNGHGWRDGPRWRKAAEFRSRAPRDLQGLDWQAALGYLSSRPPPGRNRPGRPAAARSKGLLTPAAPWSVACR